MHPDDGTDNAASGGEIPAKLFSVDVSQTGYMKPYQAGLPVGSDGNYFLTDYTYGTDLDGVNELTLR